MERYPPDRIGIISNGLGQWALAHVDEADDAIHYVRAGVADAQAADIVRLRDALLVLHRSVCGPTGFADAVRHNSGKAYPWPSLDVADELARAALEPKP